MVESTFSTIFSLVQIKYPNWKGLTTEEKKSLGSAWLPIFQEYLQQNWVKWGLPLMITGGVVLPRIIEMKPEEKQDAKSPKDKRKDDKKKPSTEDDGESFEDYKKRISKK